MLNQIIWVCISPSFMFNSILVSHPKPQPKTMLIYKNNRPAIKPTHLCLNSSILRIIEAVWLQAIEMNIPFWQVGTISRKNDRQKNDRPCAGSELQSLQIHSPFLLSKHWDFLLLVWTWVEVPQFQQEGHTCGLPPSLKPEALEFHVGGVFSRDSQLQYQIRGKPLHAY